MEDELLAAIAAAPDDDNPRLVYADHLLQRGDLRGELIGLQCALARADAGDEPVDEAMLARERELLAEHAELWTYPLRGVFEGGYQFRRGLVEHLAAWTHRDVTFPTVQPGVTDLDVIAEVARDRTDRLGEVMAMAPLLRSLTVRGEALMHPLPPSWAALHTLHLTESGYGTPETISSALRQLPSLRRLHLTSASLVDEQLAALLEESQPLAHLGIHLGWHISSRPSQDLATERIAANPALHGLRSLHLAGTGGGGIDRLACLTNLERLSIDRCGVPVSEVIALVAQLPALTMLEYQFADTDRIEVRIAPLLAAAPRLRRLAITGVTLVDPEALAHSGLRRLILERCRVDDAAAKTILDALGDAIEIQLRDDGLTTLQTQERLESRALRYRPAPPRYPPAIVEVMPSNKIMAVKLYRELTGSGLADAKMAVERLDEDRTGRAAYNHIRAQSRWCRP